MSTSIWTNAGGNLEVGNMYAGMTIHQVKASRRRGSGMEREELTSSRQVRRDVFPRPIHIHQGELSLDRAMSIAKRTAEEQSLSLRDFLLMMADNGRFLLVPHWLILSVVTPVWLGLLVWRARRGRPRVEAGCAPL